MTEIRIAASRRAWPNLVAAVFSLTICAITCFHGLWFGAVLNGFAAFFNLGIAYRRAAR